MSGFGFDVFTGAVTAPDEVWDMEIKKDPGIQEFRDKPMATTAELAEILEGSQANGRRAIYPAFLIRFRQSLIHKPKTIPPFLIIKLLTLVPISQKRERLQMEHQSNR